MEEDIDIEEHDVLDNPVIKYIFPDISILKKEIQYFNDDCSVKEEPEFVETESQSFLADEDFQANTGESNLVTSSRPLPDIENEQYQPIKSNKIILGSKPSPSNIVNKNYTANFARKTETEETVKIKHLKVILPDIRSYLNNSGRYCHKCCTLFISKRALYAHKSKVHGKILSRNTRTIRNKSVVQTRYKCIICVAWFANSSNLSRHFKNVHKKYMEYRRKKRIKPDFEAECTVNRNVFASKKASTKLLQQKDLSSKEKSKTEIEVKPNANTKEKVSKTNNCKKVSVKKYKTLTHAKETNMKTSIKKKVSSIRSKNLTTNLKNHPNKVLSSKRKVSEQRKVSSTKEDTKIGYVTRAKHSNRKNPTVCLHCKEEFPDQKSLIDHMYEILNPKSFKGEKVGENKNVTIERKENKSTNKEVDGTLFVCRHCSYYLPSIKAYFVHIIKFHKVEVFMEVKREKFNAQCRFCPSKSTNLAAHNTHIIKYHRDLMKLIIVDELETCKEQEMEKRGELSKDIYSGGAWDKSFALESILFECSKCNVCFLSSNFAQNHKDHMEILINWKCSICNLILKQQYKRLHMKQHSFSEPIKVINMGENSVNNILYNCTKCAIHFTEERYQEHYPKCGIETTDSSYCKICDILVDKSDVIQHEYKHEQLKDISDFTIIDCNIIVDALTTLRKRTSNAEDEAPPRKRLYEQVNCLTYCHTCKCYLSDMALKRKVHIEKSCSQIPKFVCNICGLVLTNVAMKTHRQRHKNEKKLRLQDYKFYDLHGKLILPPLPEYPHCESCCIHFLTKNAIKSHICDETDFMTCEGCNIKLSETAYKLHMPFHLYVIQGKTSTPGETSIPWLTPPTHTATHNETKTLELKVSSEVVTDAEISKIKPNLKKLTNSEMSNATTQPDEMPHQELEMSKTLINENELITNSRIPNNEAPVRREDVSVLVVIYSCKTCCMMIDTYDEVIEHCRAHYSTIEKDKTRRKKNIKRNEINLEFDRSAFINRRHRNYPRAEIKVIEFDPSYFVSENKVWVKHVFRNVSEDVAKEHIDKSIYQHEHRIKFECIQTGSSSFKLYKCDKCGNCVDHGSVFKHALSKCFGVRKHPCTFCGLPFISPLSRNNHEKIHKKKYAPSLKSFSIMLFNQAQDNIYNDGILCTTNQYILYQCRNCNGIAEKSKLAKHACDENMLEKCSKCGLLIFKKEYEAHVSKHVALPNYCSLNFKVILFGNNKTDKDDTKILSSSFSGTVYDYTLYKCQKCEICIKNFEKSENHICSPHFDLERSLCSKCNLYFSSLILHMKQHKTDTDFIKENMNVIIFDGGKKQHVELTLKEEKDELTPEKGMHSGTDTGNTDHSVYKNVESDENGFNDFNNKIVSTGNKKCLNDVNDSNNTSTASNGEETSVNSNNTRDIVKECAEKNANDNIEENSSNTHSEEGHSQKNDDDEIKNNVDRGGNTMLDNIFTENDRNDGAIMIVDNLEANLSQDDMISCKDNATNIDDVLAINVDVNNGNNKGNEESEEDGKERAVDTAILFKCKCGLHFLNKPNVIEHLKKCKSKMYKQNCSKCNFLFNPSELFSHLLVHHRDKMRVQNFSVIEFSGDDIQAS